MRASSRHDRFSPGAEWFARHHRAAERVLEAEGTRVLVCCPADERDVVLGYLVASHSGIVQMVYCKCDLRRHGIARALLQRAALDKPPIRCAILTPVARAILTTKRLRFSLVRETR